MLWFIVSWWLNDCSQRGVGRGGQRWEKASIRLCVTFFSYAFFFVMAAKWQRREFSKHSKHFVPQRISLLVSCYYLASRFPTRGTRCIPLNPPGPRRRVNKLLRSCRPQLWTSPCLPPGASAEKTRSGWYPFFMHAIPLCGGTSVQRSAPDPSVASNQLPVPAPTLPHAIH